MNIRTDIRHSLLAVAIATFLAYLPAGAQISVVISSSSSQSASKEELKEVFAGAKLTWSNGSKIQVVDQPETDMGKKFYEGFVGKSVNQVRTQWTKLVLSGQAGAPAKCADDAAVKKAVADNPNAVGYISSSALDGTVKEIQRIQ